MENIKDYVFARLREPSTWRGIFATATAFGLAISPELQTQIIGVGIGIIGIIGMVFKDSGFKK